MVLRFCYKFSVVVVCAAWWRDTLSVLLPLYLDHHQSIICFSMKMPSRTPTLEEDEGQRKLGHVPEAPQLNRQPVAAKYNSADYRKPSPSSRFETCWLLESKMPRTRSNRRVNLPVNSTDRSKLPNASPLISKKWNPDTITIDDIREVCEILLSRGLSLELAAMILNFAEYWQVQRFTRNVPLTLEAGFVLDYVEASALYLQTGPLGYGEGFDLLPAAIPRKVVFRIVSRDSGDRSCHSEVLGTYRNGASWIDASIFREDESWTGNDKDRQEPIHVLERGLIEDGMLDALEGWQRGGAAMKRGETAMYYLGHNPNKLPSQLSQGGPKIKGGFELVKNKQWLVQRNLCGGEEFLEHRIEWKSECTKDMSDKWILDGAGSGRGFIDSLQRGDRIGVWPRAWVSF
jgi:hypothetical protein